MTRTCMIKFTDIQVQQLQEQFSIQPIRTTKTSDTCNSQITIDITKTHNAQSTTSKDNTPNGHTHGFHTATVIKDTYKQNKATQRHTNRDDTQTTERHSLTAATSTQQLQDSHASQNFTQRVERPFTIATWIIPFGYYCFLSIVTVTAMFYAQYAYTAASIASPILFSSMIIHSMCSQTTLAVGFASLLVSVFPVLCIMQDVTYIKEYCCLFSVFLTFCSGKHRFALTHTGLCLLVVILSLRAISIPPEISCYIVVISISVQIAQESFRICRCNIHGIVTFAL